MGLRSSVGLLRPGAVGSTVLLAVVLAGVVIFRTSTPVILDLPPLNYHLLLLPFTGEVEMDRAGVWYVVQYGTFCLCWVALAVSLAWAGGPRRGSPCSSDPAPTVPWWRRPSTWRALGVLAYGGLCGAALWKVFNPWLHWLALVAVLLLLWRRRPTAAALLLVAGVSIEACMVAGVQAAYGLSVGSPWIALGVALGAGAVALWALRRRWLLILPAILLAALGWGNLLYGGAIHRHHDLPAAGGACRGIQARILNPLTHRGEQPAWAVLDRRDGLVVAGLDFIMLLSHRGELLQQWELPGLYRIQQLSSDGDAVVGAGSTAIVRWVPGQRPTTLLAPDQSAGYFVEFTHVAVAAGRINAAGVHFPVIYQPGQDRRVFFGELRSHANTGVSADPDQRRLFVWDMDSIGEVDPLTLELKRLRRFSLLELSVNTVAGRRYLYRARPFSRAVDVLDSHTLEVVRTLRLSFSPRFIAVDDAEAVLAASDMMGNRVSLWDLRRGRHLGYRSVGPRPRGVSYAGTLGAFVGVSACGLYQLDGPTRRITGE